MEPLLDSPACGLRSSFSSAGFPFPLLFSKGSAEDPAGLRSRRSRTDLSSRTASAKTLRQSACKPSRAAGFNACLRCPVVASASRNEQFGNGSVIAAAQRVEHYEMAGYGTVRRPLKNEQKILD